MVEDHAASARRTLVDCSDEVGHGLNTIPRVHRLNTTGLVAALETGQQHLRLKLAVSVSQAVDPPGYPREWEADVLLADGGVAHLRPIRPSDADRLVAFYERVSPSRSTSASSPRIRG